MSSHPLYLTKDERAIFDALSEELRNGWKVEQESLNYDDSTSAMRMRLELLRLHDPVLLRFQDAAKNAKSPEDLQKLMDEVNLSGVRNDDMMELFFALGPSVMSALISHLFSKVENDAEVENIAVLSGIRHELLVSFQPSR